MAGMGNQESPGLCPAFIYAFFGKSISCGIPFFPMLRNNSRRNLMYVSRGSQGDE